MDAGVLELSKAICNLALKLVQLAGAIYFLCYVIKEFFCMIKDLLHD